MEGNYSGFGYRRKRNIHLANRVEQDNQIKNHGIQWGNNDTEYEIEDEYVQDTEMEESLNLGVEDEITLKGEKNNTLYIDGKPIKLRGKSGKRKFSETHIRFTTYLEKDLHATIQIMNKQGYFDSITQFINDSVKTHLLEHFTE